MVPPIESAVTASRSSAATRQGPVCFVRSVVGWERNAEAGIDPPTPASEKSRPAMLPTVWGLRLFQEQHPPALRIFARHQPADVGPARHL